MLRGVEKPQPKWLPRLLEGGVTSVGRGEAGGRQKGGRAGFGYWACVLLKAEDEEKEKGTV